MWVLQAAAAANSRPSNCTPRFPGCLKTSKLYYQLPLQVALQDCLEVLGLGDVTTVLDCVTVVSVVVVVVVVVSVVVVLAAPVVVVGSFGAWQGTTRVWYSSGILTGDFAGGDGPAGNSAWRRSGV